MNQLADEAKKEHFGGGLLPMTMGKYIVKENGKEKEGKAEVIKCVRYLQSNYSFFSPIPYQYPGPKTSDMEAAEEFVTREIALLERWLAWKAPELSIDEDYDEVIQTIENAISEWYPIPSLNAQVESTVSSPAGP